MQSGTFKLLDALSCQRDRDNSATLLNVSTLDDTSLFHFYRDMTIASTVEDTFNHVILLDSGAEKSIANLAFIKRIPHKTILDPPQVINFIVANGQSIKAVGIVDLKLEIAGKIIHHTFHILPGLKNDIILGRDFMTKHKVVLDFDKSSLTYQDSVNLALCEDYTVKPHCATLLRAYVRNNGMPDGLIGCVHISDEDNELLAIDHDLHVFAIASRITNGEVNILIHNNSGSERTVPRDLNATFDSIDIVDIVCHNNDNILDKYGIDETDMNQALDHECNMNEYICNDICVDTDLPIVYDCHQCAWKHTAITDLLTEDMPSLTKDPNIDYVTFDISSSQTTSDNKHLLRRILRAERLAFVPDSGKLGFSYLWPARIKLKPNIEKTSLLKPYRVPFHLKDAMISELNKLINNNIIEECESSPYNTPVFIICKAGGLPGEEPKYRFLFDFRWLSDLSLPVSFYSPVVSNIFDTMAKGSTNVMTTLDVKNAFR